MGFAEALSPRRMLNGDIHSWYRIALGFSDHLVSKMLDRFNIQPSQWVIDPFCGSGTTLVECMKRGINSVGIDANPSSCFAARVKTNWKVPSADLNQALFQLEKKYSDELSSTTTYRSDPTYMYLEESGMLDRGWISPKPLHKAIKLKFAIKNIDIDDDCRNILLLALIDEVVNDASNVKFGPQLYCGKPKDDVSVWEGFNKRVNVMVHDLDIIGGLNSTKAIVYKGDSRDCDNLIKSNGISKPFSAVISSPPYPGEHDYTRHARLELAFLEQVTDRSSLRAIKKQMIRSNTKNIYKGDSDCSLVQENNLVKSIVDELKEKVKSKTHGFARLYPTVVQEYFGGMKRHFQSLRSQLTPGAKCAYVVGDQSSYLQVYIPTAEILSSIIQEVGYDLIEIIPWKTSWATKTAKKVNENILIFCNK